MYGHVAAQEAHRMVALIMNESVKLASKVEVGLIINRLAGKSLTRKGVFDL